jgi:hypothetical protein
MLTRSESLAVGSTDTAPRTMRVRQQEVGPGLGFLLRPANSSNTLVGIVMLS